ncbi:MAG: DHA2 family efflux MFS transporter permease subunit [Alicyclobacillaceae bacterium]|nr:DHA2 family efflux MFS transporter permease subunit [Alicyclobacillaceae bacterium]MCY0897036.1 DHA2 family efflux MFS transporter permease subunit [Alicyclobacillaceae bacterium]
MEATSNSGYEFDRIKAPWLQLAIIILGVFMAILDTSVVNVAIPTMETELSASTAQIQWVLTGYMLVLGVLIPISGWLTDKFGPKRLFLFALFMFTLGSALSGAAWNLDSIIFFRVIQAIGGGFMMPVSMAMVYRIFPPNRRGMVMGILGIAMMAAPAFGPALSGYLVEYSSWRWIFYINVPIGIAGFFLGLAFMHEFSHGTKGKLDVLGFSLSTVGFFLLLYGFNEVPNHGWGSMIVVLCLTIGILSLIALVFVELNVENPVINLAVLKSYMFSMSLVITSIVGIALFSGIFLLPLYLQNVMGFSALKTGLFMTPAALVSAVFMPISGRLMDKIGARPLGIVGLAAVTLATFGFSGLTTVSTQSTIQWLYIARSFGMALTMMPVMTAGMNTVPVQLVSQASAMSNTVRQVSSSLGIAVLTSYMTKQDKIHLYNMASRVTNTSAAGGMLTQMQQMFQAHGMSLLAAKQAAIAMMDGLLQNQAFVGGLNDTFFVSTLLLVVSFVLIFFFGSRKEREIRLGNLEKKKSQLPSSREGNAPLLLE